MTISPHIFEWLVSGTIFTTSAIWFVVDVVRLRRALPYSKQTHDRVFGSVIGLAMCTIGMAGVLKYHLG